MGEQDAIKRKKFNEIDLNDDFFESLKSSYPGFEEWFQRKGEKGEFAFVLEDDGIQGFLYLKEENESDDSIEPKLNEGRKLKVGTFKIKAHGTKLGERFIKIIIDEMFKNDFKEAYVTIFEEHEALINLLVKYGFVYHGMKNSKAGNENVYVKSIEVTYNDILKDYPKMKIENNKKFLLSIMPKFHTRMFPDSKLKTETEHNIDDISFTNSIEKIYLSGANLSKYGRGDLVVIYRTADFGKKAEYSSVASSICVVEEIKHIDEFKNYDEFYDYCKKHSVFSESELEEFWNKKKYKYLIKMLYNMALNKRPIRKQLIEDVEMNRSDRWVAVQLTDEQFLKILELGEVNESFIIN